MIRMIRSAFLALVLASLAASAAFAAPHAGRRAPAPASGLAAVWEWAVSMFAPALPVSKTPGGGIMTKEGSSMDPNGKAHLGAFSVRTATSLGRPMNPDGL
jgi:hypothetical protein